MTLSSLYKDWTEIETYLLQYYSIFAADTLLYAVILTFDLEHSHCIAYDVIKLCTKFECNWRRYCDFNIWANDLEYHLTCCAQL